MKRVRCFLLMLVAGVLSAGRVSAYQFCPLQSQAYIFGFLASGSVRISGTHYDTAGNVTRAFCDSKAGDQVWGVTGGSSPPGLDVNFGAVSPSCAPIRMMEESFSSFGPLGTEVQVVKNGVPKRECAFHGGLEYVDSALSAFLVAHTVRKFDRSGQPTTEKGSYTINSYDGQIFIGKISIKYR